MTIKGDFNSIFGNLVPPTKKNAKLKFPKTLYNKIQSFATKNSININEAICKLIVIGFSKLEERENKNGKR